MSSSSRKRKASCTRSLATIAHPHAAGIDVGSRFHAVAVSPDVEEAVEVFGCTTPELRAMLQWLLACGVTTVALESTGVYWIPVAQILEAGGLEVILVHPEYAKQGKRKKPHDMADAVWLQQLHAFGLLPASFRPADAICRLRTFSRLRETAVQEAARYIQRMQKALEQMNLQIHKCLTDVTGQTGMQLIRAIVAGERDPEHLARFRNPRVKCSREELIAALTGDYRREHLFALQQALAAYDFFCGQREDCEQQLAALLVEFTPSASPSAPDLSGDPGGTAGLSEEARATQEPTAAPDPSAVPRPTEIARAGTAQPVARPKKARSRSKNESKSIDFYPILLALYGVDVTQLLGIGCLIALTLVAEIGLSVEAWPTEKHFTTWLRLAANVRKSGEKVLSSHTRKRKHRAAWAFILAALSVCKSQTPLGAWYRSLKVKKGAKVAMIALARRIAVDYYRLLKYGPAYVATGRQALTERQAQRRLKHLQLLAAECGYDLLERQPAA